MPHVIETVTFKINDTTSPAAFVQLAAAMNSYLTTCPGFMSRRLSVSETGVWIDTVAWADMDAAKAAAASIETAPEAAAFMGAIDGPSVTMLHSTVAVAVN